MNNRINNFSMIIAILALLFSLSVLFMKVMD